MDIFRPKHSRQCTSLTSPVGTQDQKDFFSPPFTARQTTPDGRPQMTSSSSPSHVSRAISLTPNSQTYLPVIKLPFLLLYWCTTTRAVAHSRPTNQQRLLSFFQLGQLPTFPSSTTCSHLFNSAPFLLLPWRWSRPPFPPYGRRLKPLPPPPSPNPAAPLPHTPP